MNNTSSIDFLEWKNHIRCEICDKKINLEEIYKFSDLNVCVQCKNFLNQNKNKPMRTQTEDYNDKHSEEEKPKKKKKN